MKAKEELNAKPVELKDNDIEQVSGGVELPGVEYISVENPGVEKTGSYTCPSYPKQEKTNEWFDTFASDN